MISTNKVLTLAQMSRELDYNFNDYDAKLKFLCRQSSVLVRLVSFYLVLLSFSYSSLVFQS